MRQALAASIVALIVAQPAQAADVALIFELPTLHTPFARYHADARNVSEGNLGLRASFAFPTGGAWQPCFGPTVRLGQTGLDTPMAQARMDAGLRRLADGEDQLRSYFEAGAGVESVFLVDPLHAGELRTGGGPYLGVGVLTGPDGRGLLGLRLSGAWIRGGYRAQDAAKGWTYTVQPSNVSLALAFGQEF